MRPFAASCTLLRMTDSELPEFYRRYIACCNEHRIADLGEFVARDVIINGTDAGLNAYTDVLAVVVRAFPDYRLELRHLGSTRRGSPRTSQARGRIAEPSSASKPPVAPSTRRSSPSTALTPAGSPRSGGRPFTRTFFSSSAATEALQYDARIRSGTVGTRQSFRRTGQRIVRGSLVLPVGLVLSGARAPWRRPECHMEHLAERNTRRSTLSGAAKRRAKGQEGA